MRKLRLLAILPALALSGCGLFAPGSHTSIQAPEATFTTETPVTRTKTTTTLEVFDASNDPFRPIAPK